MNRNKEGDVRSLVAGVDSTGRLRLEGQDLGPSVEDFFGSDEYEYARSLTSEDTDHVALLLWNEKHTDDDSARQWLVERWPSLVQEQRSTLLLKLLRVRFKNDGDFSEWLERHGIVSEFWSRVG